MQLGLIPKRVLIVGDFDMILHMGAHYGSIHLRTAERAPLIPLLTRFASRRKLRLYVAPAFNDWIAIYPSENGQDFNVSAALARQLDCDVSHTGPRQ